MKLMKDLMEPGTAKDGFKRLGFLAVPVSGSM